MLQIHIKLNAEPDLAFYPEFWIRITLMRIPAFHYNAAHASILSLESSSVMDPQKIQCEPRFKFLSMVSDPKHFKADPT